MSAALRNPRRTLVIDGRMLFSSGIGRYLREILSRAPVDRAFELEVMCNSPAQRDWVCAFVPLAVPMSSGARIYSVREQLLALQFPPNTTYWVPHYNVPWLCRCRLVATVHDVAPLALPDVFNGRMRRWAARFYFDGVRRRTRHIIAVSQFTRSELQSRGLAGSGNVSVITNGVSSFWFCGEPVGERSSVLLYVGNPKPHKNLARLIDSIEIVRGTHPVELAVAGRIDGFRTGLSGGLIERLRTTPWIRLLGETNDKELREHYRRSDALVFPSLYEGFGLPVLEAMAAGCPVVASSAGALVELAGRPRGEGGVVDFFDPYDVRDIAAAITRSLELPARERERIRAEGRRIASSHTWDRTAADTWALLAGNTAA
jgi:glycosyltransferase involved in cell wall biosynthesis